MKGSLILTSKVKPILVSFSCLYNILANILIRANSLGRKSDLRKENEKEVGCIRAAEFYIRLQYYNLYIATYKSSGGTVCML